MSKNFAYTVLFIFLTIVIVNSKITAQPAIQWEKSYGGSTPDVARSVQQTTDGGYIVAGISRSNDGDAGGNNGSNDYWILKLDMNGVLLWENNYGGSSEEFCYSIQQTTDGGYIVGGQSQSDDGDVGENKGGADFWIVKLDENGALLWEKNYGGSSAENGSKIFQTNDGGYIVAGNSRSNDGDVGGNNGESDYWIIKLDTNGALLWEKNYGGSINEYPFSIQSTTDGGYILAGQSRSNDGDVGGNNGGSDYWIVKLDVNGDLLWEKNYGGSANDGAHAIRQTIDGGYIVAGQSQSNDGDVGGNNGGYDYWVIKLDVNGNLVWEQHYGGSNDDDAQSVIQTIDGGYIVAGYSLSNDGDVTESYGARDYWIIKLDSQGNSEWKKNYGGSSEDIAFAIEHTLDDSYIIAGTSSSSDGDVQENNGAGDFWIVKYGSLQVGTPEIDAFEDLTVSPNPSYGRVLIHLDEVNSPVDVKIFNALGLPVYSINQVKDNLEIENIQSGQYYISVSVGDKKFYKKLIVN